MSKVVILAEKPSQGRAYAEAFNKTSKKDGYIEVDDNRFFNGDAYITWGFGHLVELVEPEKYDKEWGRWSLDTLPIFPNEFKMQVPKDKRKQFNIVKRLLQKSNEIIIATDADREGENIARSIIQMSGANKKSIKRLWINSLEVDEIQKGFRNLQEGKDYFSLYKEAQTRQYSDWIVGMNASRLYTLLLQKQGLRGVYSVGRVQSPTLYLIYKRNQEIKNFVSKSFYELFAKVDVNNELFQAKYKGRFETKEKIEKLLQEHSIDKDKTDGVIKSVKKKLKKTQSPRLHSLSTLQTKANKKWKYSPSDVLDIVQGLYEKKLLSYPRTDTQFITESEFAYLKDHLNDYKNTLGVDFKVVYPDARKRYVDNKKVQEHYAIIPTKQVANLTDLSNKEQNIYVEVLKTTLSMFADDYHYEETKVDVDVKGVLFHATGKVEKEKGWKTLFNEKKEKAGKKNDVLPDVNEDTSCTVILSTKKGMTKPPKEYTEGRLIQAMKNAGKEVDDDESKETLKKTKGIGTEATRSSIIETLKRQKYIEVEKNSVSVTSKGEILCKAIDGTLLSSPEMTAKWEEFLSDIGKGKRTQDAFITNIYKFVDSLMIDAPEKVNDIEGLVNESKEALSVGACPECKTGQIEDRGKFYGCSGYSEGCKFTLPKRWAGKTIPKGQIEKLVKVGKTNLIKGFKSKKGNKFDAYLALNDGKLKMEF